MPASAEQALKGLLAEGVDAGQVLDKLQETGYKISPPEGDESYGAPPAGDMALEIEIEGPEGEGEQEEEGPPEDIQSRRKSAARNAMEKSGMKPDFM